MSENGICSEDVSVKELIKKIEAAEKEIGEIFAKLLPHCRVTGIMGVVYNFSTSKGGGSVDVTLQYRII